MRSFTKNFSSVLVLLSILLTHGNNSAASQSVQKPLLTNVALGKHVSVLTNGANDNRESPGLYPSDITDGSLDYLRSSLAQEDGTVGYVNNDYNQLMEITVTIDLQGTYSISQIRYNMGHVERAGTWNADTMSTPFGTIETSPGSPYQGAWTEQNGSATLSSVTIVLRKTRTSYPTDWLFIGEIEILGEQTTSSRPALDLPFNYPNRGTATESDFLAAWQRCTTSFFDHNLPGKKEGSGDGLLWMWTGDKLSGTQNNCTLGQDCYDGHEGYDFDDLTCHGSAVFPAAAGEIVTEETGWANDGYGNRVVIRHGNSGYKTLYGHLSSIKLRTGSVDSSNQIGEMGATGCPGCGVHLHFNVYYNDELVDPSGWEGVFTDPNENTNGVKSYRQWLFPVQRRTPVSHILGTTLTAPSGGTVVYVQPDAFAEDFELSITELAPLQLPSQLSSAGHSMVLLGNDLNGNVIDQLDTNLTIEVRFTLDDIFSVNPSTLALYHWDSQQQTWIPLSTSVFLPASGTPASGLQSIGTATANMQKLGYVALLGSTLHRLYLPSITR